MLKKSHWILILLLGLIPIAVEGAADFRGQRWGQTMGEVARSERATLELKDASALYYRTQVAGLSCYLVYVFDKDRKLYQAGYIIDPHRTNLNRYFSDYQKLYDLLAAEYGKPVENRVIWLDNTFRGHPESYGTAVSLGHLSRQSAWQTPATLIRLRLWGANHEVNLGVGFFSRAYDQLNTSKPVFFGI